MAALTAEVVANSNSQIQVFTANVYSNATLKGTTWRVTGGGFTSPGTFGSETYQPSVNVSIYFGANGTSADPVVSSFTVGPNQNPQYDGGPIGNFIFDTFVTLRANSNTAAGNTQVIGLVISPFAAQGNVAANGIANVNTLSSNLANISVYAVAGSTGQNANLVFEQCLITALT